MSSAGHVLDMINRSKQNRALIKSRQEKFNRIKEKYFKELSHHVDFKDKSDLSPDELIRIKQKIKSKIKKNEIKRVMLTITMTIIVIIIIFLSYKVFVN